MKEEISAGGVVYRINDDRIQVLMIHDRYGKLTLPKGKMEQGETSEQTALREIVEETGMIGNIEQFLETITYHYHSEQYGTVDKRVDYYLVRTTGGTLKAQIEEINDVVWMSGPEAWHRQQKSGYDNNDSVLQKALQLLDIALT